MTTDNKRTEDTDGDRLKTAIWQDSALLDALRLADSKVDESQVAAASNVKASSTATKTSWAWLGGMAACLCAGVIGWYVTQTADVTPPEASVAYAKPQSFAVDEAENVILSDGSHIALNRKASLQFSESASGRFARLSQGEAYFDVAREPARPFSIDAGNVTIRVLGTAFNVDKSLNQTQIDVFHGRVAVTSRDGSQHVELVKGQRARINAGGITVSSFQADLPDWQSGWIELDDVSLNDAVYQLNRYSSKPVVLQQITNNKRISGRFNVEDITGAASLIARMQGLKINEYGDSIVLSASIQ